MSATKGKRGGGTGGDASGRTAEARDLALKALARGDRSGARRHLRQAIQALQGGADPGAEAECRLGLGLTYLRVEGADARRNAFDEISLAARRAADAGIESLFLKCVGYLREAVSSSRDVAALRELISEAAPVLTPAGRAEADRAVGVAATLLAMMEGRGALDPAVWETLADEGLARELASSGSLPPGYAHVFVAGQAQARGDLEATEREALAGRDAALDAVDPLLYVLSCGAIARVRDERGDRVGALAILFTCRASIEDLLGPGAASQVVPMIDALQARWGAEAFASALAEYRRRFA